MKSVEPIRDTKTIKNMRAILKSQSTRNELLFILGINVGNDHIRASRETMRKIRAADHQGNFHSKGGLTTWSKNLVPKALRKTEE